MEYSVEVTVDAHSALTQDGLEALSALGGVASGTPGQRRYDATVTVDAESPTAAAEHAIGMMMLLVPGDIVALEVLTGAEADRRLAAPAFPKLAGVSELTELLGVTKQRLAVLRTRADFPAPVAELLAGPVWRVEDLSTFASGWQRQPGRPASAARLVFVKNSKPVQRGYDSIAKAARAALAEANDEMAVRLYDDTGELVWSRRSDPELRKLDELAASSR